MELRTSFKRADAPKDLIHLARTLDNAEISSEDSDFGQAVKRNYKPFWLTDRKIIMSDETLGAISQLEIQISRHDCLIGTSDLGPLSPALWRAWTVFSLPCSTVCEPTIASVATWIFFRFGELSPRKEASIPTSSRHWAYDHPKAAPSAHLAVPSRWKPSNSIRCMELRPISLPRVMCYRCNRQLITPSTPPCPRDFVVGI